MRYILVGIGLVFLLFAALQYNDPDPLQWMAMYGFTGVASIFAAFDKYHRWLLWIGIVINTVWMLLCLPAFMEWVQMGSPNLAGEMKASMPYIENTREFLGLFLCWMQLLWIGLRENRYHQAQTAGEDS